MPYNHKQHHTIVPTTSQFLLSSSSTPSQPCSFSHLIYSYNSKKAHTHLPSLTNSRITSPMSHSHTLSYPFLPTTEVVPTTNNIHPLPTHSWPPWSYPFTVQCRKTRSNTARATPSPKHGIHHQTTQTKQIETVYLSMFCSTAAIYFLSPEHFRFLLNQEVYRFAFFIQDIQKIPLLTQLINYPPT